MFLNIRGRSVLAAAYPLSVRKVVLRMNVIVICLDTVRTDKVGAYGPTVVQTPNLDRFAAQGCLLTRAYAECPNTIPARTAMVAGIHTFTNRPWEALHCDDLHIAELFGDAGYLTAAFSDSPFNSGSHMHRGFQHFRHYPMGKCLPPMDGREPVDASEAFFPPGFPEKEYLFYPNTKTNRIISQEQYGKYLPQMMVEEVAAWLADHRNDTFFLWVDSFAPHETWDAPEPFASMYEPHRGFEGRYIPMPMGPDMSWVRPGDLEHVHALYNACITETDYWFGKLLDEIDELGLTENSLVAIISDHGMPLGEHGTIRKFGYPLYDELSHIVWMMRWPERIAAGSTYDALAGNVDLPETLLDAAGLGIPEQMEGRSLLPGLTGAGSEPPEHLCLGAYNYRAGVVTAAGHKFIDNRGEKPNELYFLPDDACERDNLLQAQPDLAAELHRKLWDFHEPWRAKLSRRHQN